MKILAIGSHPDDIEYGCFCTLSKYKEEGANLYYLMLTLGGDGGDRKLRKREQEDTAALLDAELKCLDLPSAYLSNDSGRATIEAIEESIQSIKPDIIFSHTFNDRHQDHRIVNQATISACRFFHGELYFYGSFSSLKYFKPTVVYQVDKYFDDKLKAISLFTSQKGKFYMNPKIIEAVAVFRAAQFGFLGKAEAFEVGGIVR